MTIFSDRWKCLSDGAPFPNLHKSASNVTGSLEKGEVCFPKSCPSFLKHVCGYGMFSPEAWLALGLCEMIWHPS